MTTRAHRTAVVLIVGLTRSLLDHRMPRVSAFAKRSRVRSLTPVFPAVTCSVQASMLTGTPVRDHGIVGNGWFDREHNEIQFWKQSGQLVRAERVWETARRRDATVTCANMFWWYNMYSGADIGVTPRPIYTADGRKIPDCYTQPAPLRDRLQSELGAFPLFQFWGPGASIASSAWIANATRKVVEWHDPTLTLVYLPHLDYAFQKHGPVGPLSDHAAGEIDTVAGNLIDFLETRGTRVMVVSEYAIEPVSRAIFPNRVLREAGLLAVREERGGELLDAGASKAFAVCDHQCAHVYVRDARDVDVVRAVLASSDGVERVLEKPEMQALAIDHPRAGELVVMPQRGVWCAYPYWLDNRRAPDFARTVEIHRKPGYDPLELFIDPTIKLPRLAIGRRLLQKRLGFRTLMDVIPLDTALVRGSHGMVGTPGEEGPILVSGPASASMGSNDAVPCAGVRDVILEHLFDA